MSESGLSPEGATKGTLDDLVALYDSQIGDVYNFVLRRCGANVGLAEDIAQETFLAAARHFRRSANVANPAWLYQVARRRLVDRWKAEARKERKLRLASGGRPDVETADVADAVVSGDRVMAALAELPASQQAAFVLHHLDGCSTREVAEMMRRSVKATESLLARARQNLAATYREQGHE
jgi:RNA polymerase sigma-70 factor (ECF subfamily)